MLAVGTHCWTAVSKDCRQLLGALPLLRRLQCMHWTSTYGFPHQAHEFPPSLYCVDIAIMVLMNKQSLMWSTSWGKCCMCVTQAGYTAGSLIYGTTECQSLNRMVQEHSSCQRQPELPSIREQDVCYELLETRTA